MRLLPLLGLAAIGCGNARLAKLESEQRELRGEYDDLQANVEALKQEMVELGMITEAQANARLEPGRKGAKATPKATPKGKAAGAKAKAPGKASEASKRPRVGHPSPGTELSDRLPWSLSRTGDLPILAELPEAERTPSPCGWSFKVEALADLSDYPLNRDGYGKSGPILLLEDDQPMVAHAMPEGFREACSGAFRHAGFTFLFSPTGTVDDAMRRTYRIAPAPEFPLPRGEDGRPMIWVYPGTEVVVSFERGWDASWGEAQLSVAGRAILGSATLHGPDLEESIQEGDFALELPFQATGPFELTLSSPEHAAWVLIDTLTLGNADHAVVVTAEGADAR